MAQGPTKLLISRNYCSCLSGFQYSFNEYKSFFIVYFLEGSTWMWFILVLFLWRLLSNFFFSSNSKNCHMGWGQENFPEFWTFSIKLWMLSCTPCFIYCFNILRWCFMFLRTYNKGYLWYQKYFKMFLIKLCSLYFVAYQYKIYKNHSNI